MGVATIIFLCVMFTGTRLQKMILPSLGHLLSPQLHSMWMRLVGTTTLMPSWGSRKLRRYRLLLFPHLFIAVWIHLILVCLYFTAVSLLKEVVSLLRDQPRSQKKPLLLPLQLILRYSHRLFLYSYLVMSLLIVNQWDLVTC